MGWQCLESCGFCTPETILSLKLDMPKLAVCSKTTDIRFNWFYHRVNTAETWASGGGEHLEAIAHSLKHRQGGGKRSTRTTLVGYHLRMARIAEILSARWQSNPSKKASVSCCEFPVTP